MKLLGEVLADMGLVRHELFLGRLEREAPGETVEEAARALGYLVADRAGNICTLEGKMLFTGDPIDAARIVAVVNGVLDGLRDA